MLSGSPVLSIIIAYALTHIEFIMSGHATECWNWKRGHGCNRKRCTKHHSPYANYLNICHRHQRGQPCASAPCFRIHCSPDQGRAAQRDANAAAGMEAGAAGAHRQADVLLDAVRKDFNAMLTPAERAASARTLLRQLHADKTSGFPHLTAALAGTVQYLTSQLPCRPPQP